MAIGDRIDPGLGRADTSGILRGSMAGASALGQGIAALGAGVGAGIKQRKQNEKEVTATVARLEALKKAQAPGSPLIGVLDEGINTLSNPDLSPREAAGMAAGFNQSVDDTFTSIESGIRQQEAERDATKFAVEIPAMADKAGILASGSEAMSKAFADFSDVNGDIDAFQNRIQRRVGGILNPEEAQKDQQDAAMLQKAKSMGVFANVPGADKERISYLEELQQLPAATIPIGEMQGEAFGTDLGDPALPAGGGILPALAGPTKEQRVAAYLQAANEVMSDAGSDLKYTTKTIKRTVNGVPVEQEEVFVNGRPTGQIIGEVASRGMYPDPDVAGQTEAMKDRYKAAEARNQFVITKAAESREARAKIQVGLELLRDEDVYTGKFAGFKQWALATANAFGIKSASLPKREVLDVLLGDFVMARVAQTKGAISEKEMALFERWAAGANKTKEANIAILEALEKIESRRIELSQEARRLRKREGVTNSIELDDALQEYMDRHPAFAFDENDNVSAFGKTSAPKINQEQKVVDRGSALAAARKNLASPAAPPPQAQPAPVAEPAPKPAPEPAPEPEPLPSGKPFIAKGANEKNTKLGLKTEYSAQLRSPNVGDRRLFLNLNSEAKKLGYQKAEDIPSGSVVPDPHRPGKFIRIP